MKKILKFSVLTILLLFIYKEVRYMSSHKYSIIKKDRLKIERILKQNYLDSTIITAAIGSKYDTLIELEYRNNCILVWNISNFNRIIPDQIEYKINNNSRNFCCTFYAVREIGPALTLKYKLSNSIPEKFSINLSQGSEVYDSFYYKQCKAYCIRTEKFGIGNNNKRSNIIFSFKEKREIIFMFYNQNIIVFYPFDNLPLDKTNFTEIIK